jgi:hypothetical protein
MPEVSQRTDHRKKLLANPALIAQARAALSRWSAEPVYLEWERILERNPEEIAAFLASPNEDATRLRQSSPFTNILTPEERATIFAEYEDR